MQMIRMLLICAFRMQHEIHMPYQIDRCEKILVNHTHLICMINKFNLIIKFNSYCCLFVTGQVIHGEYHRDVQTNLNLVYEPLYG